MAITKRLRVSFDVKAVFPTEAVEEISKAFVEVSRRFLAGAKLTGYELEVARIAAQAGPEAAIELMLKSGIVEKLKEEIPEDGVTISQFRVEVKQ